MGDVTLGAANGGWRTEDRQVEHDGLLAGMRGGETHHHILDFGVVDTKHSKRLFVVFQVQCGCPGGRERF